MVSNIYLRCRYEFLKNNFFQDLCSQVHRKQIDGKIMWGCIWDRIFTEKAGHNIFVKAELTNLMFLIPVFSVEILVLSIHLISVLIKLIFLFENNGHLKVAIFHSNSSPTLWIRNSTAVGGIFNRLHYQLNKSSPFYEQ